MPSLNNEELLSRLKISEQKNSHWRNFLSRESADDDPFVWTIRDILTLLLIFFIIMYTNASAQNKLTPANSIQAAAKPDTAARKLKQDVSRFMEQSADQGFTLRWDKTKPVFVLGERITFEGGQAGLRQDFQPVLKNIASFISSKTDCRIEVSGHTDDTPINTAQFPSNWELSASRAASVARFLTINGINARRVSIHGYAEFNPLNDNSSPENRQANRRVEIKLTVERG